MVPDWLKETILVKAEQATMSLNLFSLKQVHTEDPGGVYSKLLLEIPMDLVSV